MTEASWNPVSQRYDPPPSLAEFLLQVIEEDQVKRATMREWHAEDCDAIPRGDGYTYPCDCGVPERMALECEAKKRLLELHRIVEVDYTGEWWTTSREPGAYVWSGCEHCTHAGVDGEEYIDRGPCATLKLLALPYADHPGYRPEWKP